MKTIPYGHQWIDKSDIEEVVKVLRSDWITQGPKVKEFEDAFCRYTGVKYVVAVSSGTAALHIACLAAGIKSGNEVITSPITFVASANCILYCGGKPVFADIQEDTVNISPQEIASKITKRTKAIIPVHFAGHPVDLEEIYKIARKHNLIVIEDAAHALGAEYRVNGKWLKVGNCVHSDMTIFSFHPVKPITTGEGGMVVTNNKEYYEKLLMFRTHGITKDPLRFTPYALRSNCPWYYEMQLLGYNYRLTDIQCALGISQLKKLDKFIKRRREIVKIYKEAFKGNEFFDLPVEKNYAKSSWHLYPIRLKDKYKNKKKAIFHKMRKKGLGIQVHYIPVYWQLYYQQLGYKKGLCPNAEKYYEEAITLPLFPKMNNRDVEDVVNAVKKVVEYYRG